MRTDVMLASIGLLYGVVKQARELKLNGEGRLALHQAMAVPNLEDIKAYLKREQRQRPPKSPEGDAITFGLSN